MHKKIAVFLAAVLLAPAVCAQDALSFRAISSRHPSVRLSDADLEKARAEGECLAGIKILGSLPMDEFQPNIEWLNFRTQALLTLAKPCEVLAILEAAHVALNTSNAPDLEKTGQ